MQLSSSDTWLPFARPINSSQKKKANSTVFNFFDIDFDD